MNNVIISVDGVAARIETNLPDIVLQQLYDMCSFRIYGAEHSALFKKNRWDGSRHLFSIRYKKFPAGLLDRVIGVLSQLGYSVEVNNKDFIYRVIEPQLILQQSMEPRWYQFAACQNAISARRSIIRMATGGGKTATAAMIIASLNVPTLFLVHTKDLMRQAKEELSKFLGYQCGQIGDGIIEPNDVTVGTIQTISRALGKAYTKDKYSEEDEEDNTDVSNHIQSIKNVVNSVGLLIQDEVHRVASESAFEVSNSVKNATYRVGFSASPWRDDGTDMVIEAAFGHPSFVMTASELIDLGYLMKPHIKFRHIHSGAQPRGTYDQIYKNWVVSNEYNNGIIISDAKSMLNDGRTVMILVKQIKHGEILKKTLRDSSIECEFLSGKDKSELRYNVINDMRNKKLRCLIATTIADEGLDIKPLDGLILAGRGKSSVRALQRVGRTLRPYDKLEPLIIDYYDRVRFLEEHTCKRIQIYMSEPRFNVDMSEVNGI